jgi:magnesium transporter
MSGRKTPDEEAPLRNVDAQVLDYDDYGDDMFGLESVAIESPQYGDSRGIDPVSNWVEQTISGEAPAVQETDGASGTILMGVPPPIAPKIPGATNKHKSTKKLPPAAQKKWLMMNKSGETDMVTLSKTELTQTLGIQLRDLRLLDPLLVTSYPSAILCREKSLVVNLEYVKMIVGLEKCYVTNLEDENAQEFVSELKRRLEYLNKGLNPSKSSADIQKDVSAPFEDLPFELRVVEAALDIVLKYMEALTSDLEASAHPALDALTSKVSTENLERVRRVKNRMVRLTTRVETLREVLEKFLDDDSDMKDMNLTAREAREAQEKLLDAMKHGSQPFDAPIQTGDLRPPETPHSTLTYDFDEEEEEAIELVEQLLETYFMQADNTWNKLQTLTEYIDDTEDYVNIQLDSQRNQLIRLDLILTCLSASVALITAVTSLFAMNVQLRPDGDGGPYSWFIIISCASGGGAIFLFTSVMIYSRYKRLI